MGWLIYWVIEILLFGGSLMFFINDYVIASIVLLGLGLIGLMLALPQAIGDIFDGIFD